MDKIIPIEQLELEAGESAFYNAGHVERAVWLKLLEQIRSHDSLLQKTVALIPFTDEQEELHEGDHVRFTATGKVVAVLSDNQCMVTFHGEDVPFMCSQLVKE